eukprot:6201097-Pleurochrysis_carterae.AAC.1
MTDQTTFFSACRTAAYLPNKAKGNNGEVFDASNKQYEHAILSAALLDLKRKRENLLKNQLGSQTFAGSGQMHARFACMPMRVAQTI